MIVIQMALSKEQAQKVSFFDVITTIHYSHMMQKRKKIGNKSSIVLFVTTNCTLLHAGQFLVKWDSFLMSKGLDLSAVEQFTYYTLNNSQKPTTEAFTDAQVSTNYYEMGSVKGIS